MVAEVEPAYRHEPTLLIMDGHSAHTRNIAVIAKARDQNVILLSLPSHSTHRMQPLDVSFFKSVNTFYDAEVQKVFQPGMFLGGKSPQPENADSPPRKFAAGRNFLKKSYY